MNNFFRLDDEKKTVFFLSAAQRVIDQISDNTILSVCKFAMKNCWEQITDHNYNGEVLYDFLDNEENGITLLGEMIEDTNQLAALNCVIDAIAYTSHYSYEKENIKFYPEPVMLVDDDLIDHLIECYQTVSSDTLFISNLLDVLISDKTNDLKTLKEIIEKL